MPVARSRRAALRAVAAVVVVAVASAACQSQDEAGGSGAEAGTAVDTAAVMAAFDSMRSGFEELVAAGDFDAQAAVYTSDAVYSPPMAPPARGRDSIRAALERTTPPGATLDIQPMEIRMLGPDWAYEYGTSTLSFTPRGAEQPVSMNSTYFALFRRTADGWRIAREVLNLNQPPPGGGE